MNENTEKPAPKLTKMRVLLSCETTTDNGTRVYEGDEFETAHPERHAGRAQLASDIWPPRTSHEVNPNDPEVIEAAKKKSKGQGA